MSSNFTELNRDGNHGESGPTRVVELFELTIEEDGTVREGEDTIQYIAVGQSTFSRA